MIVLGIDPGLTGALALYDSSSGSLDIRDMPTFTLPKGKGRRTELDLYGLAAIFDEWSKLRVRAISEQVSASPQMGVTSAFSFGCSYMAVRAMCAAHFIPTELVTPQVWKKALHVASGPAKSDAVRARASAILPGHSRQWTRVKDVGRAEAALIAFYGAHVSKDLPL